MTSTEDLLEEPNSPALVVGALIAGKYRVERVLGMGGMGRVFAARHLDLDRPVAIKVVREELAREERVLERFLFEARLAAKIDSEHVCKVIDVGRLESGLPFIVMELLEGRDLGRLLDERGSIDWVESVDWILQVCEGVSRAHAAGIVHRDLKPENLLLTQVDAGPCVKILDFGISKQLGIERSITEPHGIVGSPRYMAPEQLLGAGVDERADVWSIGAIAYELITGVPAFSGDTVASICAKVVADSPPSARALAPNVPVELDAVILRCLRRDRAARFPDAASLAHALAPFASERGRKELQRVAFGPGSRHLAFVERKTLPLPLLEASNDALPRVRRRSRAGHMLLVLAALGGLAYGSVHWLGSRTPAAGEPGPNTIASARRLEPVGPSKAPAPTAPPDEGSSVDVAGVAPPPGPPASNAAPSEPLAASRAPEGNGAAPASEPAPSARPPALTAASQMAASPEPPARSSRAKLQEAWDVANFGGRE